METLEYGSWMEEHKKAPAQVAQAEGQHSWALWPCLGPSLSSNAAEQGLC
jgi:hypothetical protein